VGDRIKTIRSVGYQLAVSASGTSAASTSPVEVADSTVSQENGSSRRRKG